MCPASPIASDEPTPPEARVVMFADLLGFASLTEHYPLEIDRIKKSARPLWDLNLETIFASQRPNPLTEVFTGFHQTLKIIIDFAQMRHPLTAVTFSDSAFIATTYLFEAVTIGVDLMQSLMKRRIPMRIGIAHGSFSAVRFRSDVTVDGGDHAAHFLGTGVVRSHAAETCGIKGLRILLHPSALSLLDDPSHNPQADPIQYLECSADEQNNALGVAYEIDYWSFKPTAEKDAWHAFQDMWDATPETELKHYEATGEAINRMRVRQGEPALGKLRRRTLPHRNQR